MTDQKKPVSLTDDEIALIQGGAAGGKPNDGFIDPRTGERWTDPDSSDPGMGGKSVWKAPAGVTHSKEFEQ